MIYNIFCDGGARGNPGPAGIGFVVFDQKNQVVVKKSKFIGSTTNNVAEYSAVVEALKWLKENNSKPRPRIKFFLDSMLVVNQLTGIFKIKSSHLRDFVIQVRSLENEVDGQISYQHIPREKNKIADGLANFALDKELTTI